MTSELYDFKLPYQDVRLVTLGKTVFKIKLQFRDTAATDDDAGSRSEL